MSVVLSPVGGVAAQFFTNSGAVLTGGKIYTYAAGTSTPEPTYTTASGTIAWTNPIVLDAAGRVPDGGEIWLTDGVAYKFVLKTSNDVLIATYDNISGINSNFVNFTNDQEIQVATAGQTVFTLTTMAYLPGTHSLSVFVDGVNQYGPGASYAYEETNNTTVTFTSGLHVGAEVKFSTTQLQGAGAIDASQVSYDPPFTGSVATNVEAKLAQTVSVKDFGAVGDGVTDDTAAIQAALNYVASLSNASPTFVLFPGQNNEVYAIESQIVVDSDYNVGISGFGGTPTIKYTGPVMNTSTQDDSTGAMIYFSGTDHAFGGIKDLFVDANSAANFCVYLEGICQPQFNIKNLHMKHAQLDIIYTNNNAGLGQTQLFIDECTFFPATGATFSGQTAVCGRYPIHIAVGSNTGVIRISNTGVDSGVAGCIGITAGAGASYINEQVLMDNVRFETYGANKDVIVLDYGALTNPGEITLLNCKPSIGDAGSISAYVANATSPAGARPVINFVPYVAQNVMTYIYSDVDTAYNVADDSKRQSVIFAINETASVGRLQMGTAMPSSPVNGDYYLNNLTRQLVGRINGQTFVQPFGNPTIVGPSTTYSIAYTDFDKLIHNNNAGALTLNLPSIATVSTGFKLNIATTTAGAITLTPDGTDSIGPKTAGQTYVSSGSVGDALILMAGPSSKWIVLSKIGTWS